MQTDTPSFVRGAAGYLGGALLGGVLLAAGALKALDPVSFAGHIRKLHLDILLPADWVALLGIGLEVLLGTALLLGLRQRLVLGPAALLVVFFIALNGYALWLSMEGAGEAASACGCFGNLVQRTPFEAFWQDLVLLVPPLLLSFAGRTWGTRSLIFPRVAATLLFTLASLVFTRLAPDLPLDDLATRLSPGTLLAETCAGQEGERICLDLIVPEAMEGEHWIILAALDDPELLEAVPQLNEQALQPEAPRIWVVSASSSEQHQSFYFRTGPMFEVREAPESLLRPLYRKLPRSFLVRDGQVQATFSGLPTETGEAGTQRASLAPDHQDNDSSIQRRSR